MLGECRAGDLAEHFDFEPVFAFAVDGAAAELGGGRFALLVQAIQGEAGQPLRIAFKLSDDFDRHDGDVAGGGPQGIAAVWGRF